MTNKPDFYEVLGVAKTATQPELDKAFQSIAMKCHPDMLRMKTPEQKAKLLESFLSKAPSARGNVKTLEEFFILATEADKTLKDAKKRSTYDSYGHAGLERLASGQSAGTGQSFTDLANGGGGRVHDNTIGLGEVLRRGLDGNGDRSLSHAAQTYQLLRAASPWRGRQQFRLHRLLGFAFQGEQFSYAGFQGPREFQRDGCVRDITAGFHRIDGLPAHSGLPGEFGGADTPGLAKFLNPVAGFHGLATFSTGLPEAFPACGSTAPESCRPRR